LWRAPHTFDITPIGYEDLRPNTRLVDRDGCQVSVPTPEMAVLLRCAHLCLDFMMRPDPLPSATVNMDELATIADLARLPDFDAARYGSLCERFEAEMVTGLVRVIGTDVLGFDPLAPAADELPPVREWFPLNLWWDGISAGVPVHVDWRPGDFIVRSPGLSPIVDRLAPSRIDVDPRGSSYVLREGSCRHLSAGQPLDGVEVTFTVRPDGLRVTTRLPLRSDDRMSAIAVNVGDFQYELFFVAPDDVAFGDYSHAPLPDGTVRAEAAVTGQNHTLAMDLPWAAVGLPDTFRYGDELKILYKARQQHRGWGPVIGTIAAPLVLRASPVR
jgi:hypothetical protein